MPQGWRRPAAWLTLLLCLVPLSVGLVMGVVAAVGFFSEAWAGGAPRAALLSEVSTVALPFVAALACAGLGIAALWSTVVPRAIARAPSPLRGWRLLGLRLGGVVALTLIILLLVNDPLSDIGSVILWFIPTAWSLTVARCLTGEAGEWLFIPWQAR